MNPASEDAREALPGRGPGGPRWWWWPLGIALALLVLGALFLIALQQPLFATGFARATLGRIALTPRATTRVHEARVQGLSGIELRGLRVARGDTVLAALDTLRLRYRALALFAGVIDVREVTLRGIRVSSGMFDTARPAKPKRPSPPLTLADLLRGRFYRGLALRVERLTLEDVRYEDRHLAPDSVLDLTLEVRARSIRLGGGFSASLDSMALKARRGADPPLELGLAAALAQGRFEVRGLRLRSATSDVAGHGRLGLDARDSLAECAIRFRAEPLDLADLAWVLPGHRLSGTVTTDLDLSGTRTQRLVGTLTVGSERAVVDSLTFGLTRLEATLAEGRVEPRLATVVQRAQSSVGGWIRPFDAEPTYDLEARLDHLPSAIPGAPWWAPLARRADAATALRVRGSGFARPRLDATGRIEGDLGRIDLDGGLDLSRGLQWSVRRLAFEGLEIARIAGDSSASALDGSLVAGGRDSAGVHRMHAALDLGPSRYRAWDITRGSVRASAAGPDLQAALRIETNAGRLEVSSLAARLDSIGSFRMSGARFQGLDLAGLTGNPALASRLDGTVRAHGRGLAALRGPRGAAAALRGGRVTAEAAVDLAPSRFQAQEDVTGSLRLALSRGALTVSGGIASPGGGLQLDATARPFDVPAVYTLNGARFADLDLAAWTGSPGLASRLSGTLTAGGHPAGAAAGAAGSARPSAWDATLDLAPSRFAAARLEGGTARVVLAGDEARIAATLRAADDTASVEGTFTLGPHPHGEGTLAIPFGVLAAFIGRDSLVSRGGLDARVTLSGSGSGAPTIAGRITGRGAIDRMRVDSLVADARLENGTLVLDSLAARSNVGLISGAGRVVLADSSGTAASDLRLAVAIQDPRPLRELLRADTLALGEGTVRVHLAGPAARRTVEAQAVLRALAYDRLRVLAADVTARGTLDRGWRPVEGSAEVSVRRIHGRAALREARLRAVLDSSAARFDLEVALDEQHVVRAGGEARADSSGTHVDLAKLDIQADTVAWSLRRPSRIDVRADRFAVRDFDLVAATGHVTADGVIDRRGEQRFRVEGRGVGLDFLSAWLGREGVSGTMDADLSLEGPATGPRARGGVDVRLRSDERPFASLRSHLVWADARLEIEGRYATLEGDSLAWDAQLPLALSLAPSDSGGSGSMRMFEGAIDVHVRAARFPLQALTPLLDPRTVSAIEGTLDVDARLRGDQRALAGSGRLELEGGLVRLPTLGVTYKEIAVAGAFEGDRLVLRRAHAASGKGHFDATGEIRFVSATRVEPKLNLQTSRFVFADTPDLRAMGSARLDVGGTLFAPAVTGSLTVENSTYTLVPAGPSSAAAGASVELTDEDVRMMEETFGYERTGSARQLPIQVYEASDLDLDVTLERNNWVRQRVQPRLSLALTGRFKLRKPPNAELELSGRIEPIADRGYVEQFARSFDITGGDVQLNGKMKAHTVDIQAQYKPPSSSESGDSEVTVLLDVEGSIDNLRLTLSSEPAMSEGDIVAFIVTGRSPTTNPQSSGDASASLAKDIGLSQVTGPAQAAAQEAIGLDVLQVRFDPLQGATMVAGRYIDPQLYVGFRQPLQYKDTASPTSTTTYRTSFEVEYAIHRWLVLNLQGETSKLRSFIRARHAY